MKKIISKIIVVFSLFIINISGIFAFRVQVPNPNWQEDIIETWLTSIESDENTIFEIIQIVNNYLWFIIAWIAMVIFVVAWLKLIIWWHDSMKSANHMLLSSGIAIVVSMLSYTIVKLVINLF
jgi:hypothetical protein